MSRVLTAEQISANWDLFLNAISNEITGERKDLLLELYKDLEEFAVMAPAAISKANHNCIPGGHIEHTLRVLKAARILKKVWQQFEAKIDFTDEELAFVCLNHDLGKLGLPDQPGAISNDNNWEVEKLGKMYKVNTTLPFSTVPDRGLFLLQSRGIQLSFNEYLGIKLHDGLYDDTNKPYLISYQPESRLRSSLPIIVHQADMLAARVEWEQEWLPKLEKPTSAPKPAPIKPTSPRASQEALKRLATNRPGILDALKNI